MLCKINKLNTIKTIDYFGRFGYFFISLYLYYMIFNFATEPIRLIQEKGNEVLPITFIEGNIAKTGAYITQEEADEIITVNQMRNGGCCDGDGCC